jgi:hypothetical protein
VNVATILGLGKDLGQRFTLVDLLPTALLGLFVLALVWGGAPADSPDVDTFVARIEDLGAAEGVLLAVGLLGLALVTQPLQFGLVRVLEGYWGTSAVGQMLAAPGCALHRRRRARLERRTLLPAGRAPAERDLATASYAAWLLARRYPPAPMVLPTRLGNALRSAEDRAGRRYGLATAVTWPRLYPLLPERVTALVDDQRTQLDLAARFTGVLLAATLVSGFLLATHGWWLAVPALMLLLAWLSYRGAASAAAAYGDGLEAAYDLHRLDLRVALHLPLPATLEEERSANGQLSRFLLQPFMDHTIAYDHGADGRPEPTAAASAMPAAATAAGAADRQPATDPEPSRPGSAMRA